MKWILALFPTLVFSQAFPFPGPGMPQSAGGAACGNSYLHCRQITWDATQAGTADTTNFVGLVNATEADWATSANGGAVQNTVSQSGGSFTGTIPADFIFADSTCTTPVAGWEWESYTATTGAALVWVNIGTLSHTVNTSVWACYDKAAVVTQQNTVTATWDSNYAAVYHLAGSLNLSDSTSNARTLTNGGSAATGTGYFGNGAVISGSSALSVAAVTLGANIVTMEAWAFSSTMTTQSPAMFVEKETVNAQWEIFDTNGTLTCRGGNVNNDLTIAGMTNSNWESTGCSITGTSGVGYLQGAATSHVVDAFTDSSTTMNIGEFTGGGAFIGTLDEIRVSKAVRAGSYFTARYNQEKSGQTMVSIGVEH